jgi:urease accessory protein UreH
VDSARAAVRSLTPAVDRRETRSVGTDARLELIFAERCGRTVLAHAYAEPPFRVGPSFPEGAGLHMILASSAPGIFGGDRFEQTIRVERGARVRLTSQSALQVHPAVGGGTASIRSSYTVEDGGELSCHWDPLIPFAGARLDQRLEVHLAERAFLSWSDAFMAGRAGRGERWKVTAFAHELKLWRAGELEYLERYRIAPDELSVSRPWIANGACYFGTLVMSGRDVSSADAERLHRDLQACELAGTAADALGPRLLLVRLMADAGVAFHEARALVKDSTMANWSDR